jgi:hypothetical protein
MRREWHLIETFFPRNSSLSLFVALSLMKFFSTFFSAPQMHSRFLMFVWRKKLLLFAAGILMMFAILLWGFVYSSHVNHDDTGKGLSNKVTQPGTVPGRSFFHHKKFSSVAGSEAEFIPQQARNQRTRCQFQQRADSVLQADVEQSLLDRTKR